MIGGGVIYRSKVGSPGQRAPSLPCASTEFAFWVFAWVGRHRQPRELAEAKGATRRNPQRYRAQPPAVGQPLGIAPAHLSDAAKKCWFELESLAPRGVLTGSDRIALEVVSNLLAQFRDAPRDFPSSKITHLIGCLARLGMTPADRQKIGVETPEDDDDSFDFSDF